MLWSMQKGSVGNGVRKTNGDKNVISSLVKTPNNEQKKTTEIVSHDFWLKVRKSKLVSKSKDLRRAHDCLVQRLSPQC